MLTPSHVARIRKLRQRFGAKSIAAILELDIEEVRLCLKRMRRETIYKCQKRQDKRHVIEKLLFEKPPGRSAAEHRRIVAANFGE